MPTETTTEVEIKLTEEQVEKIKEATGLTVGQLKISVAEDDLKQMARPQALLDCVVVDF
jgi:hypothetical protein